MTPCPGTDQTASSAKRPRSASPSFRANASKIRRTIASLSAAAMAVLPARDQAVDMSALGIAERRERDEASHFSRVVVLRSLPRDARAAAWAGAAVAAANAAGSRLPDPSCGAGYRGLRVSLPCARRGARRASDSDADCASSSDRLYALSRFESPAIQPTSFPSSPGSAGSVERFDLPSSAAGRGPGSALAATRCARHRRRRAGSGMPSSGGSRCPAALDIVGSGFSLVGTFSGGTAASGCTGTGFGGGAGLNSGGRLGSMTKSGSGPRSSSSSGTQRGLDRHGSGLGR